MYVKLLNGLNYINSLIKKNYLKYLFTLIHYTFLA